MRILKNIVLLFALQVFLFTSCKEEKKDTPTPDTLPKNTSILFVNGLSDGSVNTQFKFGNEVLTDLATKAYSKYIKVSESNQKLTVSAGGTNTSFDLKIEKDKYYTVLLSGTVAAPKIEVLNDDFGNVSDPLTKFSYRFVNLFKAGNDSLSMQAYYPSYKLWATQAGAHEYVAYGKSSAFTEYTAGAAAQWRAIKSGSEDTKEYNVSGIIYRLGGKTIYYEAPVTFSGSLNKHYSIVVFGQDSNASSAIIEHESQIQQ
ncbi:DUF4397 domain-containing protein [Sporocytophaga myxococcoides]|uniref:DUF4397 domain-containing protein n=1 Tax=Sporocytophaga myxococcoides TaxID=153721 RepID=UPI0004194461|nr:DUF4397 domain-containing protein [Sporocytophaga myxococcoides]